MNARVNITRHVFSLPRWLRLCPYVVVWFSASLSAQIPTQTGETSVDHVIERLMLDGDFAEARQALDELIDHAALHVEVDQKHAYRAIVCARRLVGQFDSLQRDDRLVLFNELWPHVDLRRAMAFVVDPANDSLENVYDLLARCLRERPDKSPHLANLTAAICVVHDEPLRRRINENHAEAPDPLAIFDYFAAHEQRMQFGVRDVPVELLVYVVDTTATIDEMQWALQRYAGDQNVGARFFDIHYDMDHFRTGSPKRVTQAGWSLPAILEHGGVCADQAYFAMSVGKAIGVPTAYVRGRSSTVSHAWVGFLQHDGRRAWWNFNTGRYPEYQGVRGVIRNPQTRELVPDSWVSLLSDLVHAGELDRQFAVAATDAAKRLAERRRTWVEVFQADATPDEPRPIRNSSVESQLELLEAALRACPGYAPAWLAVRELAESGELSLEHKKRWARVLHRLCSQRYPDFELAVLQPMIATVDDVDEQNTLWNAAFRSMQQRADLAAEVRMAQATMWLDAGETSKAGQCYEEVIVRYANAGPFVIDAVRGAESILQARGDIRSVLQLYEQAWSRIRQPDDMAAVFARQSNWFRVGAMYADRLEQAGFDDRAAQVRQAIGLQSRP